MRKLYSFMYNTSIKYYLRRVWIKGLKKVIKNKQMKEWCYLCKKNYNRHIIYSIKLEKELYCYYFLMKSISQSNTRDITPHVSLTRLKFYFILNINKAKNRIGNMFKKSSIFSMDLYQTLSVLDIILHYKYSLCQNIIT